MKELALSNQKLINEYLHLFWFMTDEEFSVLQYDSPMTDDLYESIISLCCQNECYNAMYDIMNRFPNHVDNYIRKRESIISQIHIPEDTSERANFFLSNLKQKLSDEYFIYS